MQYKKFTLVELLIVCAILGILLSLLLPSLAKARESAKLAVCKSNISQISKLCYLYVKDNGRTPPERVTAYNTWSPETIIGKNGSMSWCAKNGMNIKNRLFNKYIKDDLKDSDEIELAKCPSNTELYDYRGTSYGLNNGFYRNDIPEIKYLERVNDPARMILIYETGAYFRWRDEPIGRGLSHPRLIYGHTGIGVDKWIMGFVDGHVAGPYEVKYRLDATDNFTFNNER